MKQRSCVVCCFNLRRFLLMFLPASPEGDHLLYFFSHFNYSLHITFLPPSGGFSVLLCFVCVLSRKDLLQVA